MEVSQAHLGTEDSNQSVIQRYQDGRTIIHVSGIVGVPPFGEARVLDQISLRLEIADAKDKDDVYAKVKVIVKQLATELETAAPNLKPLP